MATSGLLPTPNTMESLPPKPLERIVAHNQKARPGRSYLSQNLRELVHYGKRNLDGTYSQEDFHASHFPKQAKDEAQKMTAISGQKCLELYNLQSQHGLSVRMFVASLLGMKDWYSNKCALTWKPKVTKYSRLLLQLVPSTLPTGEIGSGLLPTSQARDWKGATGFKGNDVPKQIGTTTGLKLQPAFVEWMMGYPIGWTDLEDSETP